MENVSDFIMTELDVLWLLAFIGAVAVVGLANFLKGFFPDKKIIKRIIVLIVAVAIGLTLGPLTPPKITLVILACVLILSMATLGCDVFKKGLPDLLKGKLQKISSSDKPRGGKR